MQDYLKQFSEECLRYAGAVAGKSVLVVGCGSGEDCRPFAEAGASVGGLDICDGIGRSFQHPAVAYTRGSIEGCSLAGESFDVVFCAATMEHVHGIEAGFREMVRLTKPGGLVYSVAAPLWNSRRGHHMSCLDQFPWIHLRAESSQIVRLALDNGIVEFNGHSIGAVVDFVFSDYFNRAPARRYVEACSGLAVAKTIRNNLWLDDAPHLSRDIAAELRPKGYTDEELLAVSHSFIAVR
jgi:ubiquinone/menaquinone biosynthesis C-methylase UbiE